MPKPNIILILNDDMGYSDIGCYGGEVRTPTLDRLAAGGLRYTQFYNTARCCPSRASLLTGLYPQQADVGLMMDDDGIDGYLGDLSRRAVTIPEVLRGNGYRTLMSGKWHVTHYIRPGDSPHNWPCNRGFDESFVFLAGATHYFRPDFLARGDRPIEPPDDPRYYLTDAISDEAAAMVRSHAASRDERPFFMYVAYTAPHWPLHAFEEDIARYDGRFDAGWDRLREERYARMVGMGIINPKWQLSPRDPRVPPWTEAPNKAWELRRMQVYAAQIDRMDQGIGRIVQALESTGQLDNTLIMFLADNGGCAEELAPGSGRGPHWESLGVRYGNAPDIRPGGPETYSSYGLPWANVSDTPFRKYKHWVHEGGISTPFIVHWPAGLSARGELRHHPAQLPDIMATLVDLTASEYPAEFAGNAIQPCEGFSLLPSFEDRPTGREWFFWEHHGNCAVRHGRWKLVREYPADWALYDIEEDRTEVNDLAASRPELVAELNAAYEAWAARCHVMPYAQYLEHRRRRKEQK